MADGNAVGFMKGSAPTGGGAGTGAGNGGAAGGTPTGSAPGSAKSALDIMGILSKPTKLSKEGEAYFETIADTVIRSGREAKKETITGSNYEARLLIYNEWIAAFVFAETYVAGVNGAPTASVKDDLHDQLVRRGISGKQLFLQVVTREDYELVDRMAVTTLNAFMAKDVKEVKEITVAAFSGQNFHVTADMTAIRSFVEKVKPTALTPRMDVGLMLYGTKPSKNQFSSMNGKPDLEMVPVLAVTGYTDFNYFEDPQMNGIGGGEPKFVPIFHITGIFSPFADVKIAAAAVALTSFFYIRKGLWLKQFSSFKPGDADIGNLLSDKKTGAPIQTKDMGERNLVINTYLVTKLPMLAIDIQLGNYFIPGLEDLIENPARLNKTIDDFTGCDGATKCQVRPIQLSTHNYDGRVRIGKTGEYQDTRCIDYISLVSSGVSAADAASFLCTSTQMEARAVEIKKLFPNGAEFLFATFSAFFHPTWIDVIAANISNTLHAQFDGGIDASNYNIGALQGFQAMGMGSMPTFVSNSAFGGFNGSFSWGC